MFTKHGGEKEKEMTTEQAMQATTDAYRAHVDRQDAMYAGREPIPYMEAEGYPPASYGKATHVGEWEGDVDFAAMAHVETFWEDELGAGYE